MAKKSNNGIVQNDSIPEIHIENPQELPLINIVINPQDLQNSNSLARNVPLFVKKLWKIVNDDANEHIISWNGDGDGFIIHDRAAFIAETLPRYFKHNQLSSFVRQLNLYDFHKIQNLEKDEFEFGHPFFLRDLVQLLPLIKRKTQTGRPKATAATIIEPDDPPQRRSELQEILATVNEMKTKTDGIIKELSKLRQENVAIWGEMNSLRLKHSKQTKVINKLIHFLIAYMQKQHSSRKPGRTVSPNNSNKYLKTGPKIMELDYRYKNNPHEFWSHFDNQHQGPDQSEQLAYTVVEPAEALAENGIQSRNATNSPNLRLSSNIEEILQDANTFSRAEATTPEQPAQQFDYATSHPSSSKASNTALQRTRGNKERVGYLIDNSRVEINTIKELLKNLTPDDMTTFYKIVNENLRNQEDDLSLDSENELISLVQMTPLDSSYQDDVQVAEADLEPLNNVINQKDELENSTSISVLDDFIHEQTNVSAAATDVSSNATHLLPDNITQEPAAPSTQTEVTDLGVISDDLLCADDFLNNVSVNQYFNID